MATVTAAKVAYKRTIQPRDYESASAEIEFSFTFKEEEHDLTGEVTSDVMSMAVEKVHETLGLRAPQRRLANEDRSDRRPANRHPRGS